MAVDKYVAQEVNKFWVVTALCTLDSDQVSI